MLPAPEQTADLLLRGAGLGLLALLAVRLLQPPRHLNRLLCLGLVLGISGYLLSSGGFDADMPMLFRLPLRFILNRLMYRCLPKHVLKLHQLCPICLSIIIIFLCLLVLIF